MAKAVNIAEMLDAASMAESEGDISQAIELYEKSISAGTLNPLPYNRLMIVYRKQKDYAAEMKVLKKAIAAYKAEQEERQNDTLTHAKSKRGLRALSLRLAKALGAVDRKGRSTYIPEPLGRWMKRKQVVERKLRSRHK